MGKMKKGTGTKPAPKDHLYYKANAASFAICFLSLVFLLVAYHFKIEAIEWLCFGVFGASGIILVIMHPIEDDDDLLEEDEDNE